MITYETVDTLERLEHFMGLFYEGFEAMERKFKVFEMGWEGFVKTLVGVINTSPRNGIVVVSVDGEAVGYGVGFDDTPAYSDTQILLLWALYVRSSHSKHIAPLLFEHACELARAQGYDEVKAFNSRFSGASFRFFEELLGMRRQRIQFNKKL